MKLYIFRCSSSRSILGITNQIKGQNLPETFCENGSWSKFKEIDLNKGDNQRIGLAPNDTILKAIEENGYYINKHKVKFEIK